MAKVIGSTTPEEPEIPVLLDPLRSFTAFDPFVLAISS